MHKTKVRAYLFVIILSLIVIGSEAGVMAQEFSTNTPAPEVTEVATADATEVVIVPPVEATRVETAVPPENPRGGFTLSDLTPYVPYALAVLAIIAIAGLGVLGLALTLLYKSQPIARPIINAVGLPVGESLVRGYEDYAKLTPQIWDDELAKAVRAEFEKFKTEMRDEVAATLRRASSGMTASNIN